MTNQKKYGTLAGELMKANIKTPLREPSYARRHYKKIRKRRERFLLKLLNRVLSNMNPESRRIFDWIYGYGKTH